MNKMHYLVLLGVLALIPVACAEQATPMPSPGPISVSDILEISWQWAQLVETEPAGQAVVPDPASYTLLFMPGGTLHVTADCNTGSGSYALKGNNLTLDLGPMTMAACPPDSLHDQYLALLGQVETAAMDKSRLVLGLKDDAGHIVFNYGGPAGIPEAEPTPAGGLGFDLESVVLDTMDFPYALQPSLVPATPYDDTQPPGPTGLPEHIEINFGAVSPQGKRPGEPVIYIIPVAAYRQLWEGAGNPSVTNAFEHLQAILAERPLPVPPFGMPVLPFEEVGGVNDLAIQGEYLDLNAGSGVRFVGRFVQDANPVSNEGLRYIFQGFSNDGKYLIAFYYPVTTAQLPNREDVSADEQQAAVSNPETYLRGKVEMLNALAAEDWDPNLSTLDAVFASLTIGNPPFPEQP
jgi:heat shock protein HslJ